jgi:hypothetical protein
MTVEQQDVPKWRDRPERVRIPMERWHKDHWSLLAYVERSAVDEHGALDWNKLSLSRRNWPMLYGMQRRDTSPDSSPDAADLYGLGLKPENHVGGAEGSVKSVKLEGHCEADALMDLVDAGLVTVSMPPVNADGSRYSAPNGQDLPGYAPPPSAVTTGFVSWMLMPWARFGLTDEGWEIAGRLRKHLSSGGIHSAFNPSA